MKTTFEQVKQTFDHAIKWNNDFKTKHELILGQRKHTHLKNQRLK